MGKRLVALKCEKRSEPKQKNIVSNIVSLFVPPPVNTGAAFLSDGR